MKHTTQAASTRAKLGKYAFFLGSAATLIGRAGAQTVAQFTFENSYSTGAAGTTGTGASTGATSGMLTAEAGMGTAIGVHASASTVYSFPSGNGSVHAFSSSNFAVGDYYQFTINAAGYTNIAISYDQAHSTTGPEDFILQYSTDGGNTFTNFASYSLPSTGSTAFSSTAGNTTAFNNAFNFSGVTGLNNKTDVFRIVVADLNDPANTSGGSTVGSTGTSRIDNFIETGTAAAAPEPSSVALLSIAGAGAVFAARRRKRA